MIKFVDFSQNIEPFLASIITNPEYIPNSDEFLKVAYDTYYSTTLDPQSSLDQDKMDENPFNNPFERVYDRILSFGQAQFQSFELDEDFLLKHLLTIKQRIKVIDHAFRYLNKKRSYFILNVNQCKIGSQLSLSFFLKIEPLFNKLLERCIENILPLFKPSPNPPNFQYLINLNYICLLASHAMEICDEQTKLAFNKTNKNDCKWDRIYEIYGHNKINIYLSELFERTSKFVTIKNLPEIIESLYNFSKMIKNLYTRTEIYNTIFKYLIQNTIQECLPIIAGENSPLEMIKNKEKNKEIFRYLRALSFHNNTIAHVENFFKKFEDEFIQCITAETTVKKLSNDFIDFLSYIDFFNALVYENIYRVDRGKFNDFMTKETKNKFKDAKFNKIFGDGFSSALATIIDHFMKKEDNLTNKKVTSSIDLSKMIQLLSYVIDRDVFLSHHVNYMFIRISTRSTISMKNERDFIEKVQSFVHNDANFKNAFDLLEQCKNEEFESLDRMKISFYLVRHILAPTNRKFPFVPLPKDYKALIDKSEANLQKRWKGRIYEWLHYLTTLTVRITRNKRYVLVNMSLGQFVVFSALFKHQNLTLNDLHEITNIDESYLDIILKSFKKKKFVTADQKDPEKVIYNLDEKFEPKMIVNLCDNWSPTLAPQVKNL